MRRGGVVALGLLVLVRCSAFGGADDSSEPVQPPSEAGADAGGTPSDAGSNDAASCQHTFCEDFESFDPQRWTDEGAAAHEVSGALGSKSGSKALVLEQGAAGDDHYFLLRSFQGPVKRMRCSFQLFIDRNPVAFAIPLHLELAGNATSATYGVELYARPQGDTRAAYFTRTALPNIDYAPIVPRTWTKIELEIPVFHVWMNDVEIGVPDSGAPEPPGPYGTGFIKVGIATNAPNVGGWRLAIDDVACDIE